MGKQHRENPFTAYSTEYSTADAGYGQYLETMASIYKQLGETLKPKGRCVIEVSNLKHEDGTLTTLAWDIAGAVSQVLLFEGEIVIAWHDTYGYGYDHSYCLVFAKR